MELKWTLKFGEERVSIMPILAFFNSTKREINVRLWASDKLPFNRTFSVFHSYKKFITYIRKNGRSDYFPWCFPLTSSWSLETRCIFLTVKEKRISLPASASCSINTFNSVVETWVVFELQHIAWPKQKSVVNQFIAVSLEKSKVIHLMVHNCKPKSRWIFELLVL